MSRPRIDGDAVIPKASGSHLTTVTSMKHARPGLRLGNTRLFLPMSVVPLDTRSSRYSCFYSHRPCTHRNGYVAENCAKSPLQVVSYHYKQNGRRANGWKETNHEWTKFDTRWPISFGPHPSHGKHKCIICTDGTSTVLPKEGKALFPMRISYHCSARGWLGGSNILSSGIFDTIPIALDRETEMYPHKERQRSIPKTICWIEFTWLERWMVEPEPGIKYQPHGFGGATSMIVLKIWPTSHRAPNHYMVAGINNHSRVRYIPRHVTQTMDTG